MSISVTYCFDLFELHFFLGLQIKGILNCVKSNINLSANTKSLRRKFFVIIDYYVRSK